ncbi:sialidase family protein [Paenibacillus thiaminolyticus]|uniref:sialidase family protein n=1 Tax=Paenibacillus thiaminolyticus TaxID=49283 RepID=UPI002542C76F|nr:sialidase family protein [Paenibacillus thiaminolyticus]WII35937.1 sialidase family protein [Paenibacillus thiaminolyticus]
MINVMNTAKKKAGAAILCGALALTLGTGATTTFAAEANMDALMVKNVNGVITFSTDGGQTWSENAPAYMETVKLGEGNVKVTNTLVSFSVDGIKTKVMMKEENGTKLYSTDDGQTWSETAPEGMPALPDGEGNILFKMLGGEKEGIKTKVMVKEENGTKLYSTDDGQTWSEKAPEGMPAFDMGGEGNIIFKMNGGPEDGVTIKVMVKEENGTKLYSTDDGQTWSETAPEGLPALPDGKGNVTFKMQGGSEDGIKTKLMVKEENGTKLYSTDDGLTWSETAPEGMPAFGKGKGEQGGIAIQKNGTSGEGMNKKVMAKEENGVLLFSTDDGQTWSEQAPEGVKIKK